MSNFKLIQRHPYHLVDQSPWPFLGGISALTLTTSFVMYLHFFEFGGYSFFLGVVSLIFTVTVWWCDVVRESTFQGHHTKKVQLGLRSSMILFFFAFFWAFFAANFLFSESNEYLLKENVKIRNELKKVNKNNKKLINHLNELYKQNEKLIKNQKNINITNLKLNEENQEFRKKNEVLSKKFKDISKAKEEQERLCIDKEKLLSLYEKFAEVNEKLLKAKGEFYREDEELSFLYKKLYEGYGQLGYDINKIEDLEKIFDIIEKKRDEKLDKFYKDN